MKLNSIFFIIVTGIFAVSCHGKTGEINSVSTEDLISITHKQFETGNMVFGDMQKKVFEQLVHCHGNIVSKPGSSAKISAFISGRIRNIYCTQGQKVSAGQIIFEISGNELIELQKDFAETASMLVRVQSEYERLKSLYSENVGTEKELIFAESEYRATMAKHSALKLKMQLLGLDSGKVEKGNFYESYPIKSPINGYISQINVSLGQYADQQSTIAEVFDLTKLQIRIAVFEKDIWKLKDKQKLLFRLLGNNTEYSATLNSISKNIDNETKTILCSAEIDSLGKVNLINNAFVEVRIIFAADTVNAVPEEAVLKSGENYYLFYLANEDNAKYYFKKLKVETGQSQNGWTEIVNQTGIKRLIAKGAYNVQIE